MLFSFWKQLDNLLAILCQLIQVYMINMIKSKASLCAIIIDNLSHSKLLDMNLTKVIPI